MSDSVALFADHPVNAARAQRGQAAGHEHLAVGPGPHAGAARRFSELYGKRGRDDHGRRSAARPGGADRLGADRSARRDRLHSTPTTPPRGATRSTRWPTPTSSASTSRPPTKPRTKATPPSQDQGAGRDRPAHRRPAARGPAEAGRLPHPGLARPSHAAAHQDAQPRLRAVCDLPARACKPDAADDVRRSRRRRRPSWRFDEGWRLMRYFLELMQSASQAVCCPTGMRSRPADSKPRLLNRMPLDRSEIRRHQRRRRPEDSRRRPQGDSRPAGRQPGGHGRQRHGPQHRRADRPGRGDHRQPAGPRDGHAPLDRRAGERGPDGDGHPLAGRTRRSA